MSKRWTDATVEAFTTNLQVLHLDGNELGRLPPSLSKLDGLMDFNVGSNQLQTLPSWLRVMTRLVRLHAAGNRISNMLSVCRCSALQELNLSHNTLSSLPNEIQWMRSLIDLDVSNNQIKVTQLVLFLFLFFIFSKKKKDPWIWTNVSVFVRAFRMNCVLCLISCFAN